MIEEHQISSERSDITPAIPLEISAELAAAVDELLQDFAEGAELETALVVERSGALVSGISSEAEVMVDLISALVAGASSAMNTLVGELGGSGNIESFHQSEERAVYLAEILDRFVLVGVSTVPVPVGVIREKARRIFSSLEELLESIKSVTPVPAAKTSPTYSLRDMALKQAAEEPLPESEDPLAGANTEEEVAVAEETSEIFFEEALEEEPDVLSEIKEESDVFAELEREEELAAEENQEPAEPTEVIELLDDGAPEIVIEDSSGAVIDSPFEAEEDFEVEEEEATESIFELEEEEENLDETEDGPPPRGELESSVFEIAEEDEEEEVIFEADEDEAEESPERSEPVFELDEDSEEADIDAFELDLEEFEEENQQKSEVSLVEEGEGNEEEGSPGSGPMYF